MPIMARNAIVLKRKYADRKHRKPQMPFSCESGMCINGHEKENNLVMRHGNANTNNHEEVPLTTNTPREVEMINPNNGFCERFFESCSAAARLTNINRTKMSRMCRAGGGKLGKFIFQYAEQQSPAVMEEVKKTPMAAICNAEVSFESVVTRRNFASCTSTTSTSTSSASSTTSSSSSVKFSSLRPKDPNELDAIAALLSMVDGEEISQKVQQLYF